MIEKFGKSWKFHDFLLHRFYVKSFYENWQVVKLPLLCLANFSHQKLQKIINIQLQSFKNVDIESFKTSRIPKINFTVNLSGRKILRSPHISNIWKLRKCSLTIFWNYFRYCLWKADFDGIFSIAMKIQWFASWTEEPIWRKNCQNDRVSFGTEEPMWRNNCH